MRKITEAYIAPIEGIEEVERELLERFPVAIYETRILWREAYTDTHARIVITRWNSAD